MIVKMEKLTILVSRRSQESALKTLRKLGLVHIKHLQQPASKDITALEQRLSRLNSALDIMGTAEHQKSADSLDALQPYIDEAIALDRERRGLLKKLEVLEDKRRWFDIWGDVSVSSLGELREAGIFVKLYICPKSALKKLPDDKAVCVLKKEKNTAYLVLVSTSGEDRLEYQEEEIPGQELSDIHKLTSETNGRLTALQNRVKELAVYGEAFIKYKKALDKEIDFYKVKHGMLGEESFCYLEGFCPKESLPQIKKVASAEGWGYITQEPDDPQEVPTLIRNPRWLRIIDPVFKFMGTLPGYAEFDISFWFLIFFSLFFAMIIGDAGYGIVLLSMSVFARKKLKQAPWEPFVLMYVLSAVTILWGAVTGTWFGYEKIGQLPFFSTLIIDKINSFVDTNQIFMMYLCFIVGVIHLGIAHGIAALKVFNSLRALAHVGWISILWGLFYVAGNLVLDRPVPEHTPMLVLAGALAVVLFSSPRKNILKGIFISAGNLPLKVISSFSDIVSYIRLFAVGTATVVVAKSFNDMALSFGFNNLISGLITALILFSGHTLNILLGLMSVIVHGIRLNMLEFSGHLDMQWSGREYKPFRE